MEATSDRLTQTVIQLDHLTHNVRLLRDLVDHRPLWPTIKANAYGHGAEIVARHLVDLGCDTLCVAHVSEAIPLIDAGVHATFVILSATLPEHAEAIVASGCEPVLCTTEMARALADEAKKAQREVAAHLMVDTGMGRIGILSHEVLGFLDHCCTLPCLRIKGLMSHFPRADEANKVFSLAQLERFQIIVEAPRD